MASRDLLSQFRGLALDNVGTWPTAPRFVLWLVVIIAFGVGGWFGLWSSQKEHLEQLQHSGSVPLLLDRPAFLVGVGVQGLVALVAWLVARLLVRTLAAENVCHPLVAHWSLTCVPSEPVPVAVRTVQSRRSRAPPSSR